MDRLPLYTAIYYALIILRDPQASQEKRNQAAAELQKNLEDMTP